MSDENKPAEERACSPQATDICAGEECSGSQEESALDVSPSEEGSSAFIDPRFRTISGEENSFIGTFVVLFSLLILGISLFKWQGKTFNSKARKPKKRVKKSKLSPARKWKRKNKSRS